MNIQKLKYIVSKIIGLEAKYNIASHLEKLKSELDSYVNNPQDANIQSNVKNAMKSLETAHLNFTSELTPADEGLIDQIDCIQFVDNSIVDEINESIRINALTPAIIRDAVAVNLKQWNRFMQYANQSNGSLEYFEISVDDIEPGKAEIGFQIPRELFNNDLDGLIKELNSIKRIIRCFSELSNGTPETIEIAEISTTDPLIIFVLGIYTIRKLGDAVKWSLDVWKTVEEIRSIRQQALSTQHFTDDEIKSLFDKKIDNMVKQSVQQKIDEMVPKSKGPSRANEQRTDLGWCLQALLSRIERGMTVEIRFLPPSAETTSESAEAGERELQEASLHLQELANQLVFPPPESAPILPLTQAPDDQSASVKPPDK